MRYNLSMSFKIKIFKKRFLKRQFDVESPNKKVVCTIKMRDGRIFYEVKKENTLLVRESRLGFLLRGESELGVNLSLVRTQKKSVDEVWETLVGEQKEVRNNYNEMTFYVAEESEKKRLFSVRFRVFNDGVTFRYEIPPQPSFQRIIVEDELTEFNVDLNGQA